MKIKNPLSMAVVLMALVAGCAAPGPATDGQVVAKTSPASKGVAPPASAAKASAGLAGGSVVALAVANAGFENSGEDRPGHNCPPQWWCTMHSDPTSFRFASVAGGPSGRFLRGERVKNEPWALVTQTLSAKGLEGRVVRVSGDVNSIAMKDGEGSGPIIRVYAPGGRVVAAERVLRSPGSGWGRASVELLVPKGAELIDIGVVMYGDGIADFDNIAAGHRAP